VSDTIGLLLILALVLLIAVLALLLHGQRQIHVLVNSRMAGMVAELAQAHARIRDLHHFVESLTKVSELTDRSARTVRRDTDK
jgi:predicted Holliday junction resolvase-like endonuclease